MLKTKLIGLTICLVSGVLVVCGLNAYSKWRLNANNGFIRLMPSHKIIGTGFVKLRARSDYFLGGDSVQFYLGSNSHPYRILKCSTIDRRDTATITISGLDTVKLHQGLYLRTAHKQIAVFDGVKPVILSGTFHDGRLKQRVAPPFFTAAVPTSDNQFALRVVLRGLQNSIMKLDSGRLSKPFVLEGQGDGLFSNDGVLLATPDGSRIFYAYYYRNLFICLDSSLKLLYKGKTIDTIAHSNIIVGRIHGGGELTLSVPPLFVNKQACVTDQYLFIHSAVRADNEDQSAFEASPPIDVYRTDNGKYLFSIYIPDFAGEKMRDFHVFGSTLVVLYEHYIYYYKLKF